MSNLNVAALKRLFPKNTTRRQGGKVNGANRKRVQVMLPPDTLARLDELIEHDEQARSAAVALGVEVLYAIQQERSSIAAFMTAATQLKSASVKPSWAAGGLSWLAEVLEDSKPQP